MSRINQPSRPSRSLPRGVRMTGGERLGTVMFVAGGAVSLAGALAGSSGIMAAATFVGGAGYFLRDYTSSRSGSVTPMSVYMLATSVWFGLANLIGEMAIGSAYEVRFYLWASRPHLFQAQLLATASVFIPALAYRVVAGALTATPALVGYPVSPERLRLYAAMLLILSWTVRLGGLQFTMGVIDSFVAAGSLLFVFLLTTQSLTGAAPSTRWRVFVAAAVLGEAMFHLAFAFLRSGAVWPVLAFALPYVWFKRLTRNIGAMLVVCTVLFAGLYEKLADSRTYDIDGAARIVALTGTPVTVNQLQNGLMLIVARLSTTAQLSQVIRLTEDEGFQDGATVAYVFYALIPRALWRDKPTVTPGQWFAEKIGRGMRLSETRFSNAINMTPAGELYLNFGWMGAVLGMFGLGALYGVLWNACRNRTVENPVALTLVYVVFAQALWPASHFGTFMNLVFWYLLCLALTLAQGVLWNPHGRTPAPYGGSRIRDARQRNGQPIW